MPGMANENNNINELVTDDDSTAELEELTLQQVLVRADDDGDLEVDADTFAIDRGETRAKSANVDLLKADLESRNEAIERLQFDVERLRARLLGLQSEVHAREDITSDLNRQIAEFEEQLKSSRQQLKARDRGIKALREEIRQRGAATDELAADRDALRRERDALKHELDEIRAELERASQAPPDDNAGPDRARGRIATFEARDAEMTARLARTEAYADELRRQLEDKTSAIDRLEQTLHHTKLELEETASLTELLQTRLDTQGADNRALVEQIGIMQWRHNEELERLRSELSCAEDTATQNQLLSEQLAADLEKSNSYRDEMERMLSLTDDEYREQIKTLESELGRVEAAKTELTKKLASRNEAVETLLAELTSLKNAAGGREIVEEQSSLPAAAQPRSRVHRMLIGRIDKQELRFPLFKDRVTIGRTQQNDIQLNVPYISRRHAVILTEGNTTRVVDWGSRNGVYVNARRVTEHFLKTGDRVTIGNAEFRYEERPRRES